MRFLKVFALVLLFLISMMFFIQNTEILSQEMSLHLNFYIDGWMLKSTPLPFYFLLLIAFGLGSILVLFYFLMEKIRLSGKLKECNGKLSKLEQEVNSLRNLPLENTSTSSYTSSYGTTSTEKKTEDESEESNTSS